MIKSENKQQTDAIVDEEALIKALLLHEQQPDSKETLKKFYQHQIQNCQFLKAIVKIIRAKTEKVGIK